jgi:CRISPR/Cas system CSM-associated protein Csm5 (group 7 of RAMP superfamily)
MRNIQEPVQKLRADRRLEINQKKQECDHDEKNFSVYVGFGGGYGNGGAGGGGYDVF